VPLKSDLDNRVPDWVAEAAGAHIASDLRDPEYALLTDFWVGGGNAVDDDDSSAQEPKRPERNVEEARCIHASLIRWLFIEPRATDAAGRRSRLRIRGQRIVGKLDLSGLRIEVPLFFDRCTLDGIDITDSTLVALDLDGSWCSFLQGDNARIDRGLMLRRGACVDDQLGLRVAAIGGDLNCEGGHVKRRLTAKKSSRNRSALQLDGARISGRVFLRNGFRADGRVAIRQTRIEGGLICNGAYFCNPDEDALDLDGATVGGLVTLRGSAVCGSISAQRASIRSELELRALRLRDPKPTDDGPYALKLAGAEIDGGFKFRDARITGGIDLYRATAAALEDDIGNGDEGLGSWSGVDPVVLEGFSYAYFTEAESKLRHRWLRETSGFQAGAWRQLISVYRAQGRDDEAASAAVAMHNDRLDRAGLAKPRWVGRQFLRFFVGHGYRPWFAGVWALGIILVFAAVVWGNSDSFVPEKQGVTGSPQPFIYAADTFLPIVDFGEAARWMPTDWTRWVEWLVISLGWALTTIFVAAFTRIVRS
jgi:hypothetical protein